MKTADKPLDEEARLAALRAWEVLDTEPEAAFDDLVEIAARTFDVPVGLVTLIDEERQWFKAAVGLEAAETPREYAVCAHAILEPDRTLVVPDTEADERFRANPALRAAGLRFYAGAPIVDPAGQPLGTVCVLGGEPLDEAEEGAEEMEDRLAVLEALSRQAMRLIEHRAAARGLADALRRVRALEEMVPVCAWCRRVRDDEDYWSTVEEYLAGQGVDLTHGICPECSDEMMRDVPVPGGRPEGTGA